MYLDYYKLRGLPFQLNPDHRFFFESRQHRKAVAYLEYGLTQGEGFIVITGEVGTGKTTLIDHILSQHQEESLVMAKVVTTQLEAEDFLRLVLLAFGVPPDGLDKATILTRFEAFLADNHRIGRRSLLFVDEAQNLPLSTLEELRMLSNFQADHTSLLQSTPFGWLASLNSGRSCSVRISSSCSSGSSRPITCGPWTRTRRENTSSTGCTGPTGREIPVSPTRL